MFASGKLEAEQIARAARQRLYACEPHVHAEDSRMHELYALRGAACVNCQVFWLRVCEAENKANTERSEDETRFIPTGQAGDDTSAVPTPPLSGRSRPS